jgi:Fic family protein
MAKARSFTKASSRSGVWVRQNRGTNAFLAFVPRPLPPTPPLVIDASLQRRLEAASLAIGRLDGIGRLLPGPDELLYSYIRKEAVLSSQIEGTQSSLADLLLHEHQAAPGVALEDVEEVTAYVSAVNRGLEMLRDLPMSLRVIREIHRVLVRGRRGENSAPGEFRRIQNWIGGHTPQTATFVPPPPHEVLPSLYSFETYLHSTELPVLIKAGLAHAQFETIHPFLDGNGRLGRILIPLLLVADRCLERPWLYVSLHFKRHRSEYYDLLQRVRTHGAWEQWLAFYLEGVAIVADEAVAKIRQLLLLFERDRLKVNASRGGSMYQRVALQSNLEVYDYLRKKLAIRIPEAAAACGTTKPTVLRVLGDLQALGIAKEVTGRARDRIYVYQEYVDILNSDPMSRKPRLRN